MVLKTQKYSHGTHWISKGLLIAVTMFLQRELYCDSETTADVEDGLITKSDRSDVKNAPCDAGEVFHAPCRTFEPYIDFLYWKADEDGLEYGTRMIANPLIGESSTTTTKLLDLRFKWDPGFRLGGKYLFDNFDCWAINLDWTHIRNHARASSSAQGVESQVGPVNTIIPTWVNLLFELRSGASSASAHWHVNYDTLDLDLEKSLPLSKRFVLNPYFGFRAAWINQHYHAKYNSVFILMESATPFTREVTFRGKNNFSGFGLRGGAELLWQLGKQWHLFSELSGNVIYGKFRVKMKNLNDQGLGEGSIPPMPLNFYASENLWRVRLNFEEAIGLGWETFFKCERYRLCVRAAYELSQWINQNQLFSTFYFRGQDTISSFPIRSQGDLSFHGIRVGLQLDF
jgi:hypothetical protein